MMLADVPQTVATRAATAVVFRAEVRIWKHNVPRGRAWSIRCSFTNVHGSGTRRRGKFKGCTFRVWRHRNYTGQLVRLPLTVTLVPRVADATFEDGSGWAMMPIQPGERVKRSLYLNPGAP